MAHLRLFASVREAAGTGRADVEGATVGEVLEVARARFGPEFERALEQSRVWLNGDDTRDDVPVRDDDEIAVLPPVSGGS